MTTYTVHADGLFDPAKPILGSTALETRDNLIAAAEGGSGAPKIANKVVGGRVATNLTITSLGDFGGILLWGIINTSGVCTLTLGASTNGSTFSTGSVVGQPGNSVTTPFYLFVDFATGSWRSVLYTGTSTQSNTGTLAGSAGLVSLRFTITAGEMSFMATPQGGQSAT